MARPVSLYSAERISLVGSAKQKFSVRQPTHGESIPAKPANQRSADRSPVFDIKPRLCGLIAQALEGTVCLQAHRDYRKN